MNNPFEIDFHKKRVEILQTQYKIVSKAYPVEDYVVYLDEYIPNDGQYIIS